MSKLKSFKSDVIKEDVTSKILGGVLALEFQESPGPEIIAAPNYDGGTETNTSECTQKWVRGSYSVLGDTTRDGDWISNC